MKNPLRQGLFHAAPAFTTTGLNLPPGRFEPFRADAAVNVTAIGLALLGAMGFPRRGGLVAPRRGEAEDLGSPSTLILRIVPRLVLGDALLLAPAQPSIAAPPQNEQPLASFFQSANVATTAGFQQRSALDDALKAQVLCGPCHRAAGNVEALSAELTPDLADAVDAPVPLEHAQDLGPQCFIIREPGRACPLGQVLVSQVDGAIGRSLQIGSAPCVP